MEKIFKFIDENRSSSNDPIFTIYFDIDSKTFCSILKIKNRRYGNKGNVLKLSNTLNKLFKSWQSEKHEYGKIYKTIKPIYWREESEGCFIFICNVDTIEKSFKFWGECIDLI